MSNNIAPRPSRVVPRIEGRETPRLRAGKRPLRFACLIVAPAVLLGASLHSARAAGTWVPLANNAPGPVNTMLLLSDGTVMAEGVDDFAGTAWFRLTPDSHGSYVNGTWTTLAPMHDTRLFFSSDLMPNGKVLIAGGEYGTGGSTAEVYDPTLNTWTYTNPPPNNSFIDSISTTLPNGNVLIAPVFPSTYGGTVIYNWATDTWSAGGTLVRGYYQDEASWVKLPDQSILTIDPFGQQTERYIPSLNQWVSDSNVPVPLYDPSLGELGAGFLLPNGNAFYLGSTGNTAIYTPSGGMTPGTWVAGPVIPNGQGTPDAPAAMMPNGKILCAVGPAASFDTPTTFYEYDYTTNAFTQVNGPFGTPEDPGVVFNTRFLDTPDGNILYSNGGSQIYEYVPSGAQIASGKPVITSIGPNGDGSYKITGTQLSGISEGAAYGDDAQMDTDYPIVKLTASNGTVYFGRTFNWSSMAVMQGSKTQTTQFTPPIGMPPGTYSLVVIANGIASDAHAFTTETVNAGLTATFTGTGITLNWRPIDGLTTYNIYRGTAPGAETQLLATVTGTTYLDTTPKAGQLTYYQVAGVVSPVAETERSNEASATAYGPAAPASLTATPLSNAVALSWSASPGASLYNVKRATSAAGPFSLIARPASTRYTDTDAANGTTYYYEISAINVIGEGANSAIVSATPSAQYSAPPAPTGLKATAATGSVTITWTAAPRATSYTVKRATRSSGVYAAVGTTTTTSYADTKAVAGTLYYYEVTAANSYGASPASGYIGVVAK